MSLFSFLGGFMSEAKLQAIALEQNLAKWDGHILIALLAILEKIAPFILPFITPLVPASVVAEFENRKLAGTLESATANLTAVDWQKLWALLAQLLPIIIGWLTPTPNPTPTPAPNGPVA
jgi:hypothetical protein